MSMKKRAISDAERLYMGANKAGILERILRWMRKGWKR